jgi:hypothetical protein
MKKLLSLFFALFALITVSYAQPGDPGGSENPIFSGWSVLESTNGTGTTYSSTVNVSICHQQSCSVIQCSSSVMLSNRSSSNSINVIVNGSLFATLAPGTGQTFTLMSCQAPAQPMTFSVTTTLAGGTGQSTLGITLLSVSDDHWIDNNTALVNFN